MNKYDLSIIIPTYNLENIIENAFNSIKSQTIGFENIEVIFVDDNSTDNTFEIINNYSKTHTNVKTLKTDENSGFAGKPRNIGIKNSNGEYLLFLDGDDELLVNSCELLFNNITNNNSDICIGAHINRYKNNEQYFNPPLSFGNELEFENVNDANLLNVVPAISAKLFRKHFLIRNNVLFIENIPGQDFVFLTEAILNSSKITVLNNTYIYYRNINESSVSFKPDEHYLNGLIHAYHLVLEMFKKHSIEVNIQELIFKKHLSFLNTQILRTFYQNNSDNTIPYKVLHSHRFESLANDPIFTNNDNYKQFFKFMDTGYYTDAKRLINKIEFDLKIDYNDLKKENEKLKNKINELTEENKKLKK